MPVRTESSHPVVAQRSRRRAGLIALSIVWLAGVASSFSALAIYKSTPSEVATDAPRRFPEASAIARSSSLPTLLMFVHPRCACSRASLAELSKLLKELRGRVSARIVVQTDTPQGAALEATDITRAAQAISAASVVLDPAAREAARFGAMSSGQTLLYDRDGRLLFSGGLTNSRGHEGASLGKAHLLSALEAQDMAPRTAAVFGCKLEDGEERRDD